ncbi:hypothetical protein EYF80_057340 [Liparis tanakae]|uniref:Uncharacterized protein n=1 Tax=Liparis tanakae TaxID=230148 RepID=A0A4Z2EVD1_9TELE|nr:hypothetical protein EYF80_057340 [Liparis tanakae]
MERYGGAWTWTEAPPLHYDIIFNDGRGHNVHAGGTPAHMLHEARDAAARASGERRAASGGLPTSSAVQGVSDGLVLLQSSS